MNNVPHTGAAGRPFSPAQIKALIVLAREAYMLAFPPPDEDFDEWRRQQCMMTVERGGLRECLNEDYLPLKAHFLSLCGQKAEAQAAILRHENEPRSWALFKLKKECDAATDVMPGALAYAAGFIRNKRHVALEEADEKTIWHAVFVVRRRVQQLRKKGAA